MPLPLVPIALGLAELAPSILRWLSGERAGEVAERVVGLARQVTGEPDAAQAAARLATDREAELAFRRCWQDFELGLFAEESRRLRTLHETIRVEAQTGDAYVRRWRPTFGYVCAAAWGLQAIGVFVGIVAALVYPGYAQQIMAALGEMLAALSLQWSVALGVLGINISARSRDKALAAGSEPEPGPVGALLGRILGRQP